MMNLNAQQLNVFLDYLFKKHYVIDINIDELYNENIYHSALEIFQYDYQRYFGNQPIIINQLITRIELIGILLYRIAREFFLIDNEEIANHYSNLGRIISGFEIYYSAEIGEGLKINHGLGTVIGARCKIGKNALIHQGVTLGDRNSKRPTLLNSVTVYAGAKILGGGDLWK